MVEDRVAKEHNLIIHIPVKSTLSGTIKYYSIFSDPNNPYIPAFQHPNLGEAPEFQHFPCLLAEI